MRARRGSSVVAGSVVGWWLPVLAALGIVPRLAKADALFALGPQPPAVLSEPHDIATSDLNHDGKLDLVVAERYSEKVAVLIGTGDGTFVAATQRDLAPGSSSFAIAIGDLNGDGNPDLLVAGRHVTTLLSSARLRAGLYFLRLAQSGRMLDARVALVH